MGILGSSAEYLRPLLNEQKVEIEPAQPEPKIKSVKDDKTVIAEPDVESAAPTEPEEPTEPTEPSEPEQVAVKRKPGRPKKTIEAKETTETTDSETAETK